MVWFVAQGLKSISGTPTRETLAAALSKITKIDHQVYGGEWSRTARPKPPAR